MADGCRHLPEATLRRLAFKAPTNMLSKYQLTVPPALQKMGVERPFEVNITPKFSISCINDNHLDSGCDALCLPLSGQKIILPFKPEPRASEPNSVEARERAWYNTWVARSVAGEREQDFSLTSPNCEWFLSLVEELENRYIAKLSSTEHKTLWISAGRRHMVFTVSASFLGEFTFLPQEHLWKMLRQLIFKCQPVARWAADNKDVLREQLSVDLGGNVNAAMQALNAELRDKDPDRQERAKALFLKLHVNLSPKLLEEMETVVSDCQHLCQKLADGGERKDGGDRKDGIAKL
ncbi:hypothetical protein FN846DRAFT_914323 [Sphaerosporella brunnea]|uniref:Uncharacterized protein n=1 Tax=Sphaerosporella brunnea TaxID=1250544 RepID=A0A5J5ECB4_9PEZI|nr:hypothetical protein FN846DRAFT_914323 [Sphaerosporella brunnea]